MQLAYDAGVLRGVVAVGTIALIGASAAEAPAQEFAPVTDRDFAIDLYSGAALGSLRTVGMGGAAVAIAEGSAGSIANPAAPAVRAETSRGRWDWDWHFDYLSTGIGADSDNNGIPEEADHGFLAGPVATLGVVVQSPYLGRLSLGMSATYAAQPGAEVGEDTVVIPSATVGRLSLGFELLGGDLALGVGARGGTVAVAKQVGDELAVDVFSISGASFEVGGLWRPREQDVRLGATLSLPVTGEDVVTDGCDPLDCEGFVVPGRVAAPWQVALGGALRRGATPWNRTIAGSWRDEDYWLYALDVVVTGATRDGHGLEAYARGQLQPSGRRTVVSVRGGLEHEWLPGRLRVRGGSYWEPSRFAAPDGSAVPGRLHLTLGVDVRIWAFRFRREPYRLRLSLTADGAERYGNGGLSVGFWH
jgi:hypothetical protein